VRKQRRKRGEFGKMVIIVIGFIREDWTAFNNDCWVIYKERRCRSTTRCRSRYRV